MPGNGLVGIATSKKLGSKPQRNKQKRRIHAMLQSEALSKTQDFVLVASFKCLKTDYATLNSELTQLMDEASKWVGGLASS